MTPGKAELLNPEHLSNTMLIQEIKCPYMDMAGDHTVYSGGSGSSHIYCPVLASFAFLHIGDQVNLSIRTQCILEKLELKEEWMGNRLGLCNV